MKKIIILLVAAIALTASCTLAKGAPKTETVSYSVNMHCENCVQKLTDNLSLLKGVKDFQISLEDKTIMITFDPSKVKEDKFVKIINKLGYTVDKIENGASSVTECDDCETESSSMDCC